MSIKFIDYFSTISYLDNKNSMGYRIRFHFHNEENRFCNKLCVKIS